MEVLGGLHRTVSLRTFACAKIHATILVLLPCNQAGSLQGSMQLQQGHLHKQSCNSHPNATSSAQGQQDASLPVKEDVQRYCAAHSKEELAELLVQVASGCPQLWRRVLKSDKQADLDVPHLSPPCCKCRKCRMEVLRSRRSDFL